MGSSSSSPKRPEFIKVAAPLHEVEDLTGDTFCYQFPELDLEKIFYQLRCSLLLTYQREAVEKALQTHYKDLEDCSQIVIYQPGVEGAIVSIKIDGSGAAAPLAKINLSF